MNAWEEKILDRQEAAQEKAIEIAKNLKESGVPEEVIVKTTGLTKEEVKEL